METLKNPDRLIGDQEKVALVTSALHVPRAMREMQAAGIVAHPFPTQLAEGHRNGARVSAVGAEPRRAGIVDNRHKGVARDIRHLDCSCVFV